MSEKETPSKKRGLVGLATFIIVAVVVLVIAAVGGFFIVDFLHGRAILTASTPPPAEAKDEPSVKVPHQLQIDVARLDTDDAVLEVRGDGSRTVYFFSNSDCPASNLKKAELKKMDNVSIYTFWLPGDSDITRSLSASELCEGKMLAGEVCDEEALDRNEQLMKSLGLTPPAVITASGDILQGVAPVRILEAIIQPMVSPEADAEAESEGSGETGPDGAGAPKEGAPATETAPKAE